MCKKVKDKRRSKLKLERRMKKLVGESSVLYRCLGCGIEELIPREVVENLIF